jgi:thymidylate kinase
VSPPRPSHDRRGLCVAVLGPDGAGKSAAIQALTKELSPCFDGIERLHFRPRFRRHERPAPAVTDPHGKPPRGWLLSIFKLLHWLADYWYGYLAILRPARRRSSVVFFDRYYPDVLVDPRRYRLPSSTRSFAKVLAQWVPQPDLYVVLDVPAELLQERKNEVTSQESRRQRIAYLQMFRSLPGTFLVDAAGPLDDVTRQMKAIILQPLSIDRRQPAGVSLIART